MDMPTTLLVPALLSRTELHALVWAEPLSHLARRFGISDQSLAKLCDRFDIPRPRPGHWNKVAAGKRIAVPVLPPARTGMDDKVTITPVSRMVLRRQLRTPLSRRPTRMAKRCAWPIGFRIRTPSLPAGLQIEGRRPPGEGWSMTSSPSSTATASDAFSNRLVDGAKLNWRGISS
jgi:hypothetical protein